MDPERDPDAPTPPEEGMPVPPPDTSPPRDGLLLPLVHALIQPYVDAARSHGPTPPLRSDAWLDAHPDQQIAHLLICGAAAVISHPHQTAAAVLHGASRDVWSAREQHSEVSAVDVQREHARRNYERAEAWRRLAAEERRRRVEAETALDAATVTERRRTA